MNGQLFARNDNHIQIIVGVFLHMKVRDVQLCIMMASLFDLLPYRIVFKDHDMVNQVLLLIRLCLNFI